MIDIAWLQQIKNGVISLITQLTGTISSAPTAGSLRDILHKDGSFTFDNTTDSLEAIRDAVDTITGLLSDEQSGKFGLLGTPAMLDNFSGIADGGNPDSSLWDETDSGSQITVEHDLEADGGITPIMLRCYETSGTECHVVSKQYYDLKSDISKIILQTRMKIVALNSSACVGFWGSKEAPVASDGYASGKIRALIATTGTLVYARTCDGTSFQTENITSYITANTWFILRIELSATDAKYYIDGTLRATHSNNAPKVPVKAAINGLKSSTDNIDIRTQYVHIWPE